LTKFEQVHLKECPTCGTQDFSKNNFEQTYYVEPFLATVTYDFRVCETCGFFFVSNPLSQDSLDTYYAKAKTLRKTEVDAIETAVFASQLAFIERRRPVQAGAKMLEVGSDTGQFLDFVHKSSSISTYFLELGDEAVRLIEAKKVHHNYLKASTPAIDVLVVRHTLEHLVKPFHFLNEWSGKLSATGRIFIEVPDWTFLDSQTDLTTFEHVNHFALPNLSLLLDRAGFILEDFEYQITPGYHTTPNRVLRVLAQPKPKTISERTSATFQHIEKNTARLYQGVKNVFSKNSGKKIAFYGASWTSGDILMNAKIRAHDVIAVFDVDQRKQGQDFHGVPVLSPQNISKMQPDIIVINSSYETEIEGNLRAMGYRGQLVLSSSFRE